MNFIGVATLVAVATSFGVWLNGQGLAFVVLTYAASQFLALMALYTLQQKFTQKNVGNEGVKG